MRCLCHGSWRRETNPRQFITINILLLGCFTRFLSTLMKCCLQLAKITIPTSTPLTNRWGVHTFQHLIVIYRRGILCSTIGDVHEFIYVCLILVDPCNYPPVNISTYCSMTQRSNTWFWVPNFMNTENNTSNCTALIKCNRIK